MGHLSVALEASIYGVNELKNNSLASCDDRLAGYCIKRLCTVSVDKTLNNFGTHGDTPRHGLSLLKLVENNTCFTDSSYSLLFYY